MAAAVPDPDASDPVSSGPAGPSPQLAYEVDPIARIISAAYIGDLTDQIVLDFYRALVVHQPDAQDYDFLLDLRYTVWAAQMETIVAINGLFNDASCPGRRIAVVRKPHTLTADERDSALIRHGIGRREIRYFGHLEQAMDWLTGRRG